MPESFYANPHGKQHWIPAKQKLGQRMGITLTAINDIV
jgi:hypothetical protein